MAPDTRSKSIVDATQSKQEWVTPQILEMSAALTDGKPGAILIMKFATGDAHKGSSIHLTATHIRG